MLEIYVINVRPYCEHLKLNIVKLKGNTYFTYRAKENCFMNFILVFTQYFKNINIFKIIFRVCHIK